MTNSRQALIDKVGRPVEQSKVSTRFARTAYLAAGEGQPVICLHGAGAGAVTWYPSIGSIAKKFRVIAPDIVGY
jgi:4,5:9,10-diseco-3-hydroxy-5,9,17-trioxoandrosta-1(10),2-diene-4-oate hydrolase